MEKIHLTDSVEVCAVVGRMVDAAEDMCRAVDSLQRILFEHASRIDTALAKHKIQFEHYHDDDGVIRVRKVKCEKRKK